MSENPYDFTPPDISLRRKVAIVGAIACVLWLAIIGFIAVISTTHHYLVNL